jgi:enterochelin esterase family protein
MIASVTKASAAGDAAAVDRFWIAVRERHTPIIEPIPGDPKHVLASFIWKGDQQTSDVVLMAQPDGIVLFRDPRSHLLHIPGTDIWYRTHQLPSDAEFSYLFSVNPSGHGSDAPMPTLRQDPFDPLHYRILDGPERSIARMPAVQPDRWIDDMGAPAGTVEQRTITSAKLTTEKNRHIWVYRTRGQLQNPNLLILLDGLTYAKSVPTTRILDNLFAAHKIGPTVAVLVEDGSGNSWRTDMYFSDSFVAFLADELLPWVQKQYGFKAEPRRTVIGGESIAGLTAAFAAFRRPDVFRHVVAQSASFWLNNRDADDGEPEWLTRQFLHHRKLDVTFWIDVGQMEFVANEADRTFPPFVPGETSLLAASRHLRDILEAKGYEVHYLENYGGHEPLRWTRTLPQALIASYHAP